MGMYIHIPFCVKKCNYCDFLSGPFVESDREEYVNALCRQLQAEAQCYAGKKVDTIFLGGGTPSVLDVSQTGRIMDTVHKYYDVEEDAEVTTEANPGTLNPEKLKGYRQMGFNRLSIGLQSASDSELKVLGRIHTVSDFSREFESARNCGFTNINVDLMSSIPDQTPKSYYETLNFVASLMPEHISSYSLILEEGTPLNSLYEAGKLDGRLVDEDTDREMYHETRRILEEYGYQRYEISNYAKEGFSCRHNLRYWERGNYCGFGIGAASLMDGKRYRIITNRSRYLENSEKTDIIREEEQILSRKDGMEEFMFLGLRKILGVSRTVFFQCFQRSMEQVYGKVLQKLEKEGLIVCEGDGVRLSERGIDVSNVVLAEFLLEDEV